MGILSSLLGFKNLSIEDPSQPLLPQSSLNEAFGLGRSDSGIMINEKRAMTCAVFYTCCKVISEDLGTVPLEIYQTLPNNSLRLAPEHRLYTLLHSRPNVNMSAQVWRMAMLSNVLSNGNGYSWIKRDRANRPISLIPLDPMKTSPCHINGKLIYGTTQTQGNVVTYIEPEDMLHFMNATTDGIVGLSPVGLFKNALGLALATEKFAAQFFGNGMRTTGIFTHPAHLDAESYSNLKKSIHELATGETAMRPLVLEESMTFTPITIHQDEAQFIETQKLSKETLAMLFRCPLHLLQDLVRATNSNLEYQGRDYTLHCLLPRCVNMEQEMNYKLLGLNSGYYCEHNLLELERGDFASQTTGLLALRNGGVYSANDVLKGLRQNPIPTDQGGDIRIVQGAFVPLDSLLLEDKKPAVPETAETDSEIGSPASRQKHQIIASYRLLFRDAIGRCLNRQSPDQEFIRKTFIPAITSMSQTLLASKYGNAELTTTDLDQITGIVNTIVSEASSWNKTEATEISNNLTEAVYSSLCPIEASL